jgi:hypothetical protein
MRDSVENWIVGHLQELVGFENAVRLEDFSMVLVALALGYVLGHIRIIFLYKPNFRMNKVMKNLVFQKNEYKGIIEYDFKTPLKFLDKMQFIVALYFANKKKNQRLTLKKAKVYTYSTIIASIILFILFFFTLHSIVNIVRQPDMNNLLH